jgi:hypothetical protein
MTFVPCPLAWGYRYLRNKKNLFFVTTVLELMPLIISVDPLFFAMAVIIAFGLIFGTLLTLDIVPALYTVLLRAKSAL